MAGHRRFGVVLHAVARQLHEGLLQRGPLHEQLVDRRPGGSRGVSDLVGGRGCATVQVAGVGVDLSTLGDEGGAELVGLRRPHPDMRLGVPLDEVLGAVVREQLARDR